MRSRRHATTPRRQGEPGQDDSPQRGFVFRRRGSALLVVVFLAWVLLVDQVDPRTVDRRCRGRYRGCRVRPRCR